MVYPESIPLNQVFFWFPLLGKENNEFVPLLLIANYSFYVCPCPGYFSQVLPVFLKALPLKEDHEESMAVYSCVSTLVLSSNPQVFVSFPDCNVKLANQLFNIYFSQELMFLLVCFSLLMQSRSSLQFLSWLIYLLKQWCPQKKLLKLKLKWEELSLT